MLSQLLVDSVRCLIFLKLKISVFILRCNKNKDWRILIDSREPLMISNQDTRLLEPFWFAQMLPPEGWIFLMLVMWSTTSALTMLRFMFIDAVELLVSEERVIHLICWLLMIINNLNKFAKLLKRKKNPYSDTRWNMEF